MFWLTDLTGILNLYKLWMVSFQAAECYSRAADGGHAKAMYQLGLMYLEGDGDLERDHQKALHLMKLAAEQGLEQAQTELGVMYYEKGDMDSAALFFSRAAKKQDAVGQYYLGLCYLQGWGVECNPCKAADLLRQSAQEGHAPAMHSLAQLFEEGAAGEFFHALFQAFGYLYYQ